MKSPKKSEGGINKIRMEKETTVVENFTSSEFLFQTSPRLGTRRSRNVGIFVEKLGQEEISNKRGG